MSRKTYYEETGITFEKESKEVKTACKDLKNSSKANSLEQGILTFDYAREQLINLKFFRIGKKLPLQKRYQEAKKLENYIVESAEEHGLNYENLCERVIINEKLVPSPNKLTADEFLFSIPVSSLIYLNGVFYRKFSKVLPHSEKLMKNSTYKLAVINRALESILIISDKELTRKTFDRVVELGNEVLEICKEKRINYKKVSESHGLNNKSKNKQVKDISHTIDTALVSWCSASLQDLFKDFYSRKHTTISEMHDYKEKFGGYLIDETNRDDNTTSKRRFSTIPCKSMY